jgi:hypothetical protein
VKSAERVSSVTWIQGDRERVSARERELIVVGGIRPLREGVGVEETGGNKVQEAASSTSVDNRKGAGGPERGARLLRGEVSEGRTFERQWHETRPRNSDLLGNR